ncbi:response regulator [Paraflavisolibacter sp. H34]|uniref:response regulator n=1 Tax=Huijunlia imazamoxiresistens TaxID=3127457 RepID=UPI00301744D8
MFSENKPSYILLLEDDRDDQLFFEEALGQVALTTRLINITHSDQLFAALQAQLPDLIVIDPWLGLGSGLESVQQLKAHPLYRHIPVIMWSTSRLEPVVSQAYAAGMELFFEKPCSLSLLESILLEVFDRYLPSKRQCA